MIGKESLDKAYAWMFVYAPTVKSTRLAYRSPSWPDPAPEVRHEFWPEKWEVGMAVAALHALKKLGISSNDMDQALEWVRKLEKVDGDATNHQYPRLSMKPRNIYGNIL